MSPKWANNGSMAEPLILRQGGSGKFVFLCDHASNHIPAELRNLDLLPTQLLRHIAWDIGAADVTACLSEVFDAPAILCGVSRLVVDCNRQLQAPDLIPQRSDGTDIPGNHGLDGAAQADRIDRWFRPYHDAVESVLMARETARMPTIAVSIHSMTPRLAGGEPRPWRIAISSHLDRSLADPLLAALRRPCDVMVGDNEPYDLDPAVDYSIPFHAMRRGLPCVQVEFRQDEITEAAGQRNWALRFAQALSDILS